MTPPLLTKFNIELNSSPILTPPKYVRVAAIKMKRAITNPVLA